VAVGATNLAAAVELTPQGTGDEDGFALTINSATLNPACDDLGCVTPELGKISLHGPTSTAGSCGGVTFTIAGPDGTGKFTFVPSGVWQIPDGATCTINFQIDILDLPDVDSDGAAGLQTDQFAAMNLTSTAPSETTGSGTGSDITTVTFTCSGQVDKQVSCDGGSSWNDVGLQTANGDGNLGCIGVLDANDIKVRYQAKNTGNVDLLSCTIGESNVNLGPGISSTFTIGDGSTTGFLGTTANALACTSSLVAGEADTATLHCACDVPQIVAQDVQVTDGAEFQCCGAAVNKEVSCNGVDWFDPDFSNDAGALGCSAIEGETVAARYFIRNDSTDDVSVTCTLTDIGANASTLHTIGAGSEVILPAGNTSSAQSGWSEACNNVTTEAHEPNTADINCTCAAGELADKTGGVSDADSSTVSCLTPGFDISKACIEDPQNPGSFTADITIHNTGDTSLTCDTADQTFAGPCPPSGTGTDLFSDLDNLVIAGDTEHVTHGFTPGETVCNQATVTCTPNGGDPLPAQIATAVCPVEGEGCLTRTPGFWKSHLFVVEAVAPVVSCGLELNNHTAGLDGSTVEDLCENNNEAKFGTSPPTSSQNTQLMRQCAAAALNLQASQQLELTCENATVGGAIPFDDIEARFASCCGVGVPGDADFARGVCNNNSTPTQVTGSGCIDYLDAFNNASFNQGDGDDSLADLAGPDWNDVETEQCQIADSNHFLNDSNENSGRSYGPAK
jgi:hypothetical protein